MFLLNLNLSRNRILKNVFAFHQNIKVRTSTSLITCANLVNWEESMFTRVVVTGMGMISPIGPNVSDSWNNLVSARSGVRSLEKRPEFNKLPCQIGAFIPEHLIDLSTFTEREKKENSRSMLHTFKAVDETLKDAGLNTYNWDVPDFNVGVYIGSGMGEMQYIADIGDKFKTQGHRAIPPQFINNMLLNQYASKVAIRHKLGGPNISISNACATGLHCIGEAYQLIKIGRATGMLVGAVDYSVNPFTVAAFGNMRALTTQFNHASTQASRPFDKDRSGFVLGEGCGFLFLENLGSALARKATIYGEILGYGASCDAHHMNLPCPQFLGITEAVNQALLEACVKPEDIGLINCHATSTPQGDEIEYEAYRKLMGRRYPYMWITANKSSIGHLLGAAGAVEAIFTVLSVNTGMIPPILNLNQPIDYSAKFSNEAAIWNSYDNVQRIALKSSFGFGGTNACIVFAEYLE